MAVTDVFSPRDHAHMALALRLAERGQYTTQPNPRVGCVIAHGDDVVGVGWHQWAGEPHAEVFALRAAGARTRGATAYVTLEPCSHYGRTPPCALALIEAGVARVVASSVDPSPKIAGRGFAMLREAGIAVDVGLMADAARELNCGFFRRIECARPWLRVKLAMSLDGRTALANGASQWITGEPARADVQRWRARSSALLTASGTVRADDPRLTVRLGAEARDGFGTDTGGPVAQPWPPEGYTGTAFKPPLRVVLDRRLVTPAACRVLDGTAPTLVIHAAGAEPPPDARYAGVELAAVAGECGTLELPAVLALLAAHGCNEVQVEAGARLGGALFAAGLVDELLLYVAPVFLGDAARPLLHLPALTDVAARWRLKVIDRRMLGADIRLRLRSA